MLIKQLRGAVDRSARGEQFKFSGTGIIVTGNVPPDAEVALDAPDGPRLPIAEFRKFTFNTGFRSVWLYHATWRGTFQIGLTADGEQPDGLSAAPRANSFFLYYNATGNINAGMLLPNGGSPPAAGADKRYRLLGYSISINANTTQAAAGECNCAMGDGALILASPYHRIYVPAGVGTAVGYYGTGWVTCDVTLTENTAPSVFVAALGGALTSGAIAFVGQYRLET